MQPPTPHLSTPDYPEITGCVAALGDCVVLQQTRSGICCHQLLSLRNTNCVLSHERNEILLKCRPKLLLLFF